MIEFVNAAPEVDVPQSEYERLLGYPRGHELSDRARQLAAWARRWYSRHGRPWVYARQAESLQLDDRAVVVEGHRFVSPRLQTMCFDGSAHSLVVAAVGAGPEIEQEAQKAWQEGKPDEYFFLEVFGSAVVERLTTMTGAALCAWADAQQMAVLPHYSPGYAEWDIAEQPRLMRLIRRTRHHALPGEIDVLDSGMLRPKKSLLAVFGLTRKTESVSRLSDLIPCESCAYMPCQFRRLPYLRTSKNPKTLSTPAPADPRDLSDASIGLNSSANYFVNLKALRRWAEERLRFEVNDDGTIDALFHYEGTTCTNLGRALAFDYRVTLGPVHEGYPIRRQECGPAAHDAGHMHMCRYLTHADDLMAAISNEKPLIDQPLDDVLSWNPPAYTAGCYCEPGDRAHKWRLVLETIHYALVQREKQLATGSPRS